MIRDTSTSTAYMKLRSLRSKDTAVHSCSCEGTVTTFMNVYFQSVRGLYFEVGGSSEPVLLAERARSTWRMWARPPKAQRLVETKPSQEINTSIPVPLGARSRMQHDIFKLEVTSPLVPFLQAPTRQCSRAKTPRRSAGSMHVPLSLQLSCSDSASFLGLFVHPGTAPAWRP
ncbi:hypothetical protein HPG69_006827 [Diceros bicornis minor]|uniref:Uncharacterized protein n=1 Tax=Diceros bicornis minor TaxID=77932 RepID=A0A7J7EL46_DICBM|nr:hypothetical protein HPG69_006827 [Diceros bicornis minor]